MFTIERGLSRSLSLSLFLLEIRKKRESSIDFTPTGYGLEKEILIVEIKHIT